MTGPEHYRAAEEHLAILDVEREPGDWTVELKSGALALAIAAAQVHATLALAAATGRSSGHGEPAPDAAAPDAPKHVCTVCLESWDNPGFSCKCTAALR